CSMVSATSRAMHSARLRIARARATTPSCLRARRRAPLSYPVGRKTLGGTQYSSQTATTR
ncbi:hypothetical protein EV182_008760, partial [Spiromyces aspiralis]